MGDEELASVGPRTRVGHGEETGAVVLQSGSELVGELVARTAHAGAGGIASLDHEIRDDAVEGDAVVEAAAGEVEVVGDRDRGLARKERCMDVPLGGVDNDADILHRFGRVGGSGDARGHGESCG